MNLRPPIFRARGHLVKPLVVDDLLDALAPERTIYRLMNIARDDLAFTVRFVVGRCDPVAGDAGHALARYPRTFP